LRKYNIAVAGVTGAVGKVFLSILEERKFPVGNLLPLASHRSAGKKVLFSGQELEIKELNKNSFKNIDIALFSAGASISKEFAKYAVESGAVVIDNSSAFRMEKDVPLVVPEVNADKIFSHSGIIANPNCSTIIMVVALKPIYDISSIKRVIVSTYQAVSGAGAGGIAELEEQTRKIVCGKSGSVRYKTFPVQIAFNVIPHIDILFNDYSMKISATAVRVPVFTSHSESLSIETNDKLSLEAVRDALHNADGIKLMDDFKNAVYPTTLNSSNKDDVYVGRLRDDISSDNGISMWVVGDQLRKGAALNAIQIAEILIRG
jgi:aspartate-semialdehyde dehydrogenase